MIVVAQSRSLDLPTVLQHCLGPIPWPLAEVDGTFAKTSIAKLAELIQSDVPPFEEQPVDPVWIVDLMALLQSMLDVPSTFSELAASVLRLSIAHTNDGARVDIVADQYPSISIKNIERDRRACGGTLHVKISSGQQQVPKQWKKFLSYGPNKIGLVDFLYEEWMKSTYAAMISTRSVFLTHKETCHQVSGS